MSAINPASFVSPTAGMQLGLGPGPGALIADRDRFQEGRSKSDNHLFTPQGISDAYQGSYEWTQGHPTSLPQSTHPSTYNQGFMAQGYQPANVISHDSGRGIYSALRSQSPFAVQSYGSGEAARHSPHAKPEYKEEGNRASYTESFKAFQGLSLGS